MIYLIMRQRYNSFEQYDPSYPETMGYVTSAALAEDYIAEQETLSSVTNRVIKWWYVAVEKLE